MLEGLVTKSDIRTAQDTFCTKLHSSASGVERRSVSWRFRSGVFRVHTFPKHCLWCCTNPSTKLTTTQNRFWNLFGLYEDELPKRLSVSCEINFQIKLIDFRVAGRFARDDFNQSYLLHSGNIGGGTLGVGKKNFAPYLCQNSSLRTKEVSWEHEKKPLKTEDFVICQLSSNKLVEEIAIFIKQVRNFKQYQSRINSKSTRT